MFGDLDWPQALNTSRGFVSISWASYWKKLQIFFHLWRQFILSIYLKSLRLRRRKWKSTTRAPNNLLFIRYWNALFNIISVSVHVTCWLVCFYQRNTFIARIHLMLHKKPINYKIIRLAWTIKSNDLHNHHNLIINYCRRVPSSGRPTLRVLYYTLGVTFAER